MTSIQVGFDNSGNVSGKHLLERYGPTSYVHIGFDSKFQPGQSHPNLPDVPHPALIDTGATESCIDSALAVELKLPVVDRQTVSGVHGANEVNFHLAQIYIPQIPITIYGIFAGVHLTAGGQPHKALLGRTFLRNVTMSYVGTTGTVEISYGNDS